VPVDDVFIGSPRGTHPLAFEDLVSSLLTWVMSSLCASPSFAGASTAHRGVAAPSLPCTSPSKLISLSCLKLHLSKNRNQSSSCHFVSGGRLFVVVNMVFIWLSQTRY
jgi:hypothetical protein